MSANPAAGPPEKQARSEIQGKHPLNAPVRDTLNIISNAQSKQPAVWDVWSPDFFVWDSVLLAEANTDSMSLLGRRDGRDFSVAFCSSGGGLGGISTAKVTCFPLERNHFTQAKV